MVAAFGDCLAPRGKKELRANCLDWFSREKGLKTEQEVCAFAREILLFSATSGKGADATVDLRPGRSANRQRQSEVFLPSLSLTTKSTVNSPKADSIPAAPPIIVSPRAVASDDSVAGLGRMDLAAREDIDGAWGDTRDDQNTQLQKLRETRRSIRSGPAEASAALCLERSQEDQEKSEVEADLIVYPACSQGKRILKTLPATPTCQSKESRNGCLVEGTASTNAVISVTMSAMAATETIGHASTISSTKPFAKVSSSGHSNLSPSKKRRSMR